MAARFPVVTVTGPRQSGKTTLCRAVFSEKTHVSLEDPDQLEHAHRDPRGFLDALRDGAVIDEVQNAPELPSYLQRIVDDDPRPGRFVLTGSQHIGLLAAISQSLAGRAAVVHLLPLSLDELRRFPHVSAELDEVLWTGSYPRIHDARIPARDWLASYVATYVERDVRQVLKVGDLVTFQAFLRLCAGRSAQLLNLTSLGSDSGIDQKTAKAWLGVLETSFLTFRLPPFFHNLGKRWIKAPKLYFFDSGLLCFLLGIREPEQLRTHPLRGSVFESWVMAEIYKARTHRGIDPDLYFWRDSSGTEVDAIVLDGNRARAVEIKAGKTLSSGVLEPMRAFGHLVRARDPLVNDLQQIVVYGGEEAGVREGVQLIPWRSIAEFDWAAIPASK
jgi:hypothetical protein